MILLSGSYLHSSAFTCCDPYVDIFLVIGGNVVSQQQLIASTNLDIPSDSSSESDPSFCQNIEILDTIVRSLNALRDCLINCSFLSINYYQTQGRSLLSV